MEVDTEELKAISDNYEIPFKTVMDVYLRLKEIPCVETKDEFMLAECVERVVQGLCTNDLLKKYAMETNIHTLDHTTMEHNISDALFHIYGDESIPYLDEKYIKDNQKRFSL